MNVETDTKDQSKNTEKCEVLETYTKRTRDSDETVFRDDFSTKQ